MRRGLPFFLSPNSILLFTSPALLADGSSFSPNLNPVAAVGRRTSLLSSLIPAFLAASPIASGLQMTIRLPPRAPRHLPFASSHVSSIAIDQLPSLAAAELLSPWAMSAASPTTMRRSTSGTRTAVRPSS
jgi:hypothetical protein